ncbi:hypothetical protein KIW84_057560 [Lathyrus oleraceus]|uniref:Uncharacterized protein n=1 Tax=Pisum sativum TaxID=3888 RepID=A0A9D4X3L9_PEA|nr:hypothetical protein KIW84_057560 [Pisum sativum]
MRSLRDQEFAEFLIHIDDGVEPTKPDDMVRLPLHIAIPWEGPTSWEYLLTNNGMTFSTFKKSAEDRGFLETDHSIRDCLVEATSLRMPYAL